MVKALNRLADALGALAQAINRDAAAVEESSRVLADSNAAQWTQIHMNQADMARAASEDDDEE